MIKFTFCKDLYFDSVQWGWSCRFKNAWIVYFY